MAARTANIDAVLGLLSGAMLERSTGEWLRIFDQLDIPCAALNTLDSLIDDEHLNAVGFFKVVNHPTEGPIRASEVPAKMVGDTAVHDARMRAVRRAHGGRPAGTGIFAG